MLSKYIRVIHSDNTVCTDYSLEAQNNTVIATPLVATEDTILIGQYLAFNNIFVEIGTANENASVMSIDLWNGNSWKAAVDVLDGTKSGGATLAQSGVIQWSVNDNETWQEIADTNSETNSGLTDFHLYDLHWIRIKVSANLSAGTTIDKIKYKFTEEAQLSVLEPDLTNIRTAWSSSKTDWLDQILAASEMLALDLKGRKLIKKESQIFRFDEVYLPCAYMTLAVIYGGMGQEFIEKRDYARKMYSDLIGFVNITSDTNNDGVISKNEISSNGGGVYR